MSDCFCNIAANFPELGNYGVISANLSTNANVLLTNEGLVLRAPSIGSLAISAYSLLNNASLECSGKVSVSYEWMQRFDCDNNIMYVIPRGVSKVAIEGDTDSTISMTPIVSYTTFNASAASGPVTPYFLNVHKDGYGFSFTGTPFSISGRDVNTSVLDAILPNESALYLNNFSWEHTPPNIPVVSYSFLFVYNI